MSKWIALFISLAAAAALTAQTTAPGTVQATGSATININPDQLSLDVSVMTNGQTAQAAAQANATQTTAVINALKQLLGVHGTVQTVSYSVEPRYSPLTNQGQTVIGYIATNTVRATSIDLTLAGPLIDTANQAGATSVNNLTFSLQNPDPAKQQALTAAAKQGLAHAAAIASGLGGKAGAVVSAQENSTTTYPVYAVNAVGASATPTPVQSGPVTVSATVTITVQLGQ